MKKLLATICLMLTSTILSSNDAIAEGFALYEWGARASGMANAVVAQSADASAVAYNPAAITRIAGNQVLLGGAIITPKMLIDTIKGGVATRNRTARHYYFVPHGYFTTRINDRVSFGFGAFTRYGLGNDYPSGWDGRFNLQDVKLMTLSLNPNFAFRVTDGLSVAIGVEGQIVKMKMHKFSNYGPYGEDGQMIKGNNNMGIGFNAAMHYQFNDQWSVGFSYRSAVTHRIKGEIRFDNPRLTGTVLGGALRQINPAIPAGYVYNPHTTLHGKFRMPDHFALGVAYKPIDNLTIELGAQYTVWSKFKNFNMEFSDPVLAASGVGMTDKKWKDTYLFNIGVEYWVLDWWALRAGFSYETSPINKCYADYMVETDGRARYSLGTGFKFNNWTLDLAWTMFRSNNGEYGSAAAGYSGSRGVLPGHSYHGITHAASLSIGYKF